VRRHELGAGGSTGGRRGVHTHEEDQHHPFMGGEQCARYSCFTSKPAGKRTGAPATVGRVPGSACGGMAGNWRGTEARLTHGVVRLPKWCLGMRAAWGSAMTFEHALSVGRGPDIKAVGRHEARGARAPVGRRRM
jgi:hypothetical protein